MRPDHTPAGAAEVSTAVVDLVANVVEECQNGLSRRSTSLRHPPDRLESSLRWYAQRIGADFRRDGNVWDLRVPRAIIAIEKMSDILLIAGRRIEPKPSPRLPTYDLGHELCRADRTWRTADSIALDDTVGDDELMAILSSEIRLLAALAADALNRRGYPAVPQFVVDHVASSLAETHGDRHVHAPLTSHPWESRISVDEYAHFEATHPAYAAQVLALAHLARDSAGIAPSAMVDVGPGPGLSTIMLSELFPDCHIDAVDPSPASFHHLLGNVSGYRISPHNCDVTDFHGGPYPLAVSIGMSHHMDTRLFLRSMRNLVEPGGALVVADEMLSPFHTEDQRARHLVAHHLSYIEEAVANIDPTTLPSVERHRLSLLQSLRRVDPQAMSAVLEAAHRDRIAHSPDNGPWPRVRFAVLELEALVAGLDYDVERKTYPAGFAAMAHDEGLEATGHIRVHATVGDTPMDAGTHVFAFRRQV